MSSFKLTSAKYTVKLLYLFIFLYTVNLLYMGKKAKGFTTATLKEHVFKKLRQLSDLEKRTVSNELDIIVDFYLSKNNLKLEEPQIV